MLSALEELQRRLPAARPNEPLARHTSLRVGGPADLFLAARTSEQAVHAVDEAWTLGVPWRVIGAASNTVVADEGIAGLVVKTTTGGFVLPPPSKGGEVLLEVQAGAMLAAVGKQTALAGFEGLEWSVNVPGRVGASVVNNSGAFGSCASEHLAHASLYVPGQGRLVLSPADLGMAYRTSRLKRGDLAGVVVSATYRLGRGDAGSLRARIGDIQRLRRTTQPAAFSVGSVFANPPGEAAGRLIEQAGLKGQRVGGAEISRLHANFILNRSGARARDVLALLRHAQETVWRETRVWLTPEIQLIGRWGEDDLRALNGGDRRELG